MDRQTAQNFTCPSFHFILLRPAQCDRKPSRPLLTTQKEISDHIQVITQRQVLVDGSYSQRVGGLRRRNCHILSFKSDCPAIRVVHPADDFRQRGFACAIVANQSTDLTGVYFKIDTIERDDRSESFAYTPHGPSWLALREHRILHTLWH